MIALDQSRLLRVVAYLVLQAFDPESEIRRLILVFAPEGLDEQLAVEVRLPSPLCQFGQKRPFTSVGLRVCSVPFDKPLAVVDLNRIVACDQRDGRARSVVSAADSHGESQVRE